MVIWMIHPKHGQHPAMGHEVEAMKANGWVLRPPKVTSALVPEPAPPVVFAPVVSTMKRAYNRKVK